MLLSTGEIVSSTLMAMALHAMGYKAVSLSGAQAGIETDATIAELASCMIEPKRLLKSWRKATL